MYVLLSFSNTQKKDAHLRSSFSFADGGYSTGKAFAKIAPESLSREVESLTTKAMTSAKDGAKNFGAGLAVVAYNQISAAVRRGSESLKGDSSRVENRVMRPTHR